jgi:dihydrofolate reductase
MAPNAAIVVLPAPVVGMTFKIVQTGAYATAVCKVRTATTDGSVFFVGGIASADSSDGNTSNNSSNDVVIFGSGTLAGDFVEVTCISSTQWAVTGGFTKVTSNGVSFGDA